MDVFDSFGPFDNNEVYNMVPLNLNEVNLNKDSLS